MQQRLKRLGLLNFVEIGSGPPLLLIHGLMVTGEMFNPVIKELSTKYHLIIPDLRGHGNSRDLPPPYSVAQMAIDLSYLLESLSIKSTIVLGYSQGGAVAQQFVLDHPEMCTQLILVCTYAYNMVSVQEKIEGYVVPGIMQLLGMKNFARFIIAQGMKHLSKNQSDWLINLIGSQNKMNMIDAWKEAMKFDSRLFLNKITPRTLIVAAAKDTAVPIHHANMLHRGINHSKLVIIKDTDHTLIWSNPSELIQEIVTFLAKTN